MKANKELLGKTVMSLAILLLGLFIYDNIAFFMPSKKSKTSNAVGSRRYVSGLGWVTITEKG